MGSYPYPLLNLLSFRHKGIFLSHSLHDVSLRGVPIHRDDEAIPWWYRLQPDKMTT